MITELPQLRNGYYNSMYKKCFICMYMYLCALVVSVPGYRSRDPGFYSPRYQIFWEVVDLERGPLSLVGTIEELVGINSSGSCLENREYGRGYPLRWPRDTLYQQKLVLTSTTCGGRSVGIVRLRTKTTEVFFCFCCFVYVYIYIYIECAACNTGMLAFVKMYKILKTV
jgi:hypothetical protein